MQGRIKLLNPHSSVLHACHRVYRKLNEETQHTIRDGVRRKNAICLHASTGSVCSTLGPGRGEEISVELTHVTTRVAAHFPMPPPPPPCHGGTGDTGDTSAEPPPTRTIAWRTVPLPPPPPPPCHGGTRDIGDTREVHKHNKAQARLHKTQNKFMQIATR